MNAFMAVAKALADENRVRALMFLGGGELCVCQIIQMLPLAPSTVSKHLTILHQAGLIESRKDGRWIYYRLADKGASPAVRGALRWIRQTLGADPRIIADSRSLKKVQKQPREDLSACCYAVKPTKE